VLLPKATLLEEATTEIKKVLTSERIKEIVDLIPDDLLIDEANPFTPDEGRRIYFEYLNTRISNIDLLSKEAKDAR